MVKNFYDWLNKNRHLCGVADEVFRKAAISIFYRDDVDKPDFDVSYDKLSLPTEATLRTMIGDFGRGAKINWADIVHTWHILGTLHEGPRVFRPTAAECDFLGTITLSLNAAEYAQPFPFFVVEYPREWADGVKVLSPDGVTFYRPIFAILSHMPGQKLVMSVTLTDSPDSAAYVHVVGAVMPTMECYLEKRMDPDDGIGADEVKSQEDASRVALNACLLLMTNGFRQGPANPHHHARLRANLDKARRRGAGVESAEAELRYHPTVVSFEQRVNVRAALTGEGHGGTSGEKGPHWVRRHWQTYHHGEGKSLAKRVLKERYMRRRDLFTGRDGDTSYIA